MTPDDFKLINYALYTLITAAVTVRVGRSLHRAGDAFLGECFAGDRTMAASVNHLLLVGFYLVNAGGLALLLKLDHPPTDLTTLAESLAWKLGVALTGLGAMHFFNLYNFDSLRRRARDKRAQKEALEEDKAAIDAALATGATPPPLPSSANR